MIKVTIDETTVVGRKLLKELSKHESVAKIDDSSLISEDVVLHSWDDVRKEMTQTFRNHYGNDFLGNEKV